jgi:small Trp-rich protein
MYLVLLGVLLLTLKLSEIGPVAHWSMWYVLAPFVGAVLWWAWADNTGYYQRREMRKLDEKRDLRREKSMDALGTNPKRRREG